MEETFSLEEIFSLIKKKMALILSMMLVGIGIASLITFFIITPKYSSSAQLLAKMAQNENNSVNVNDVNANLMLINTYKDVIKSNVVIDEVYETLVKKVDFKGDEAELRGMVSVEQSQNSQMFTVKATTSNPEESQLIANSISKVFQKKAKDLIDVDKVSIIAEAPLNEKPVSPDNKVNILIGAILGLFVGLAIAILTQLMDKTIKEDKFITDQLGFRILGTVPEMTAKELNAKADMTVTEKSNDLTTRSRRKG